MSNLFSPTHHQPSAFVMYVGVGSLVWMGAHKRSSNSDGITNCYCYGTVLWQTVNICWCWIQQKMVLILLLFFINLFLSKNVRLNLKDDSLTQIHAGTSGAEALVAIPSHDAHGCMHNAAHCTLRADHSGLCGLSHVARHCCLKSPSADPES